MIIRFVSWFHIRQDASHHAGRRLRRYHEDSRARPVPSRKTSCTVFPSQGEHWRVDGHGETVYGDMQSGTPTNRSVINVSSTTGLHGNVGQANYAAAKAAVVGLTKTIAKEWGPFGVRANTIAYGLVHTRYCLSRFDARVY